MPAAPFAEESAYSPRVRSGPAPEVERVYHAFNCTTEDEALAATRVVADTEYELQQAAAVRLLYRSELEAFRISEVLWLCIVRYTTLTPIDETEEEWDFSTESAHITHSLATIGQYPAPGKTAPATHNALNLDENGIAGADVDVPRADLTLIRFRPADLFTVAYRQVCATRVARVNLDNFLGHPPGEVLCARILARRRGLGDYQITYTFRLAPNVLDIAVGLITDVHKRGWDYLWTMTEPAVDADANKLVRPPLCVNVEQTRYYANLSDLFDDD